MTHQTLGFSYAIDKRVVKHRSPVGRRVIVAQDHSAVELVRKQCLEQLGVQLMEHARSTPLNILRDVSQTLSEDTISRNFHTKTFAGPYLEQAVVLLELLRT